MKDQETLTDKNAVSIINLSSQSGFTFNLSRWIACACQASRCSRHPATAQLALYILHIFVQNLRTVFLDFNSFRIVSPMSQNEGYDVHATDSCPLWRKLKYIFDPRDSKFKSFFDPSDEHILAFQWNVRSFELYMYVLKGIICVCNFNDQHTSFAGLHVAPRLFLLGDLQMRNNILYWFVMTIQYIVLAHPNNTIHCTASCRQYNIYCIGVSQDQSIHPMTIEYIVLVGRRSEKVFRGDFAK